MNFSNFQQKIIFNIKKLFIPCKENDFRPNFLNSDFLFYFVIILLVLKISALIFFINFPNSVFFADISKVALINLVNEERISLGLNPLKESEKLNTGAYLKAKDMIEKDYFSHQGPENITPWYWFLKIGYNYKYAGENLAVGFIDSEEVYKGWFNSISHKRNLLNPKYKEVGIAVLKGNFQGNETTIVVQFLGTPLSESLPVKGEVKTEPEPKEIEQIKEEQKKEVLSAEQNPSVSVQEDKEKINKENVKTTIQSEVKDMKEDFFSFLYFRYQDYLEIIIFGTLFLIIVSLLINILVNFKIQRYDLIIRTFILIILLSSSFFLTKELIIQMIPHNFYLV